jgi:hypothetical protein
MAATAWRLMASSSSATSPWCSFGKHCPTGVDGRLRRGMDDDGGRHKWKTTGRGGRIIHGEVCRLGAFVTAGITRCGMGGATRDGGGHNRAGGRQGAKSRTEGHVRENDVAEDVGEDGAGISAGRTGAGAWWMADGCGRPR